jgi:uncharacterized protein
MTQLAAAHGRFVWYELATPDKHASRSFYTRLFGWTWREEDMGESGIYPMFAAGETFLGGLVTPRPEGAPASWLHYVTVPDLDLAVTQVTRFGGKVLSPAHDIPEVGRFAVVADPAGAVILPFQEANQNAPESPQPTPAGRFCWHELMTTDIAACSAFYQGVFGWTAQQDEMPGIGTYTVFRRGELMEGGMLAIPAPAVSRTSPHWIPYVAVADVDATVALIAPAGGAVHCRPTDIPGMGRFAVAADPHGAAFAVFQNA